jgi:hypothetical protein
LEVPAAAVHGDVESYSLHSLSIPVDLVPSSFADVSNPLISQVYLAAKTIPSLPPELPPSSRQFDDAA